MSPLLGLGHHSGPGGATIGGLAPTPPGIRFGWSLAQSASVPAYGDMIAKHVGLKNVGQATTVASAGGICSKTRTAPWGPLLPSCPCRAFGGD